MPLDVGDLIPFQFTVKDATGALTNPSTNVLTVTAPDGTTSTPATTSGGTGILNRDEPAVLPGLYQGRLVCTGPVAVGWQCFYIEDPGAFPVCSVTELKAYTRITTSTDDEQLRYFLEVATTCGESYLSRSLRRRSVTESYDGGKSGIVLRSGPIISVTSLIDSGGTLTSNDYTLDANSNIVYRGSALAPISFIWGRQNVVITYVIGPAGGVMDADIRHGVMEMTRHLWETQRGGSNLPRTAEDYGINISAFSIPNRVRELWDPHIAPGFA